MSTELVRKTVEGTHLLEVRGRLGFREVDAFRQQLRELSAVCGEAAVVDLTACPSVSSRIFPLLVSTTESMRAAGQRLLVVCPAELRETLRVLRLETFLEVHSDLVPCLDSLAGSG